MIAPSLDHTALGTELHHEASTNLWGRARVPVRDPFRTGSLGNGWSSPVDQAARAFEIRLVSAGPLICPGSRSVPQQPTSVERRPVARHRWRDFQGSQRALASSRIFWHPPGSRPRSRYPPGPLALQNEFLTIHPFVVCPAGGDQIVHIGRTSVSPGLHMMEFAPVHGCAACEATSIPHRRRQALRNIGEPLIPAQPQDPSRPSEDHPGEFRVG